ncbi:MAG TPA: hypothetical protein VGD27_08010 [Longimicrobiales bacterium]
MNKIYLLGFLLILAAVPAQAQTGLERAKAALPKDAAQKLEQTIASARARGLPTEPLVDKALEGVAKRVPPNAIIGAVRHRLDLLARADAALRPLNARTPANVTTTADALQRGVSESVLQRVLAGRRAGEPVGVALHTVADLTDRGVPVDVAIEVLRSWRERGGRTEDLREYPAAVERLIRQGVSPSAAGRRLRDDVRAGRPPSPPGKGGASGQSNPSSDRPGKKIN